MGMKTNALIHITHIRELPSPTQGRNPEHVCVVAVSACCIICLDDSSLYTYIYAHMLVAYLLYNQKGSMMQQALTATTHMFRVSSLSGRWQFPYMSNVD